MPDELGNITWRNGAIRVPLPLPTFPRFHSYACYDVRVRDNTLAQL